MVTINTFREMALALPEVSEQPHFDRPSFRIKNKIFSTIWEADNKVMVKLTPVQQSVYIAIDESVIYAVPGGWGTQGATLVELSKVKKTLLKEVLILAWKNVAPAAIVKQYELS
jgi:hypothetical protein